VRHKKKEAKVVRNNKLIKTGAFVGVITSLFMLVVLLSPSFSVESPVKAAKARIVNRLKLIIELKAQGIVGENNRGYLELLNKEEKRYKELVDAENRDRRIIYQYIAKTQGVSLEAVERLRAKQIRERAPSGQWLQDDDGRWYKKR